MANKVSFIIQIQDKYSAAARKIKAATEGVTRSVQKLDKKIAAAQLRAKKFGRNLQSIGAGMTAAVTLPLLLIGKSFVNAASDAEETSNKFNAVFDDMPVKANKVATAFAEKFKLADSTAKKFIGTTGDLLVGFGFAGDEALVMSTKINELALDLDSFQNLEGGVTQASNALTRALSGEAEALKTLGIVINQNSPKFKQMLKLNLMTTKGDLVKAKALTILQQSFQQTEKAQGDYLRTLDNSYAGTVRKATQANIKMSESFGAVLLPMANKAVKIWQSMAEALANLSPFMKTLVVTFAAIAAVAGPVLLVVGTLAIAFGALSLPILGIVLAVALVIAAVVAMASNWEDVSNVIGGTIEQIGINFGLMWDGVVEKAVVAMEYIKKALHVVTAPQRYLKGLGESGLNAVSNWWGGDDESAGSFPTTPTQAGGSIDGNITVAAAQGSEVKKTSMKTKGHNFSLGMNMAGAAMGGSL